MTHCISATVAARSIRMAGRAMLTTEPSMNAMLEPRRVATSTQGLSASAQPGVLGAARITPSSQGARPKPIIDCLVSQSSEPQPGA
jgi:hypothetical protein